VREFKVDTSNYSAEFGRNSGAVMNVSVLSGTNELHGTAYEYLRNDLFDSRDTFSYMDRDGDGKADAEVLRQNQFGATFGGPIRKNRTFFFGSWEGLRIRHSQSFLSTVPSLDERRGIFDFNDYNKIFGRFSLMRYINHREARLPLPARGGMATTGPTMTTTRGPLPFPTSRCSHRALSMSSASAFAA